MAIFVRQFPLNPQEDYIGTAFVLVMRRLSLLEELGTLGDQLNRQDKPISSWRFKLHFMMLDEGRYVSYKPWNDPINQQWARDEKNPFPTLDGLHTFIVALTGPGTYFSEGGNRRGKTFDDDTIVLVEVRNSGIHWMEPGDVNIQSMPKSIDPLLGLGISGNVRGGFHVGFADGQVWFLSNDTPFDVLQRFFTRDGALTSDRTKLLEPYCIRKFTPQDIESQF